MLVEVGKTYLNRAGSICKVVSRTDQSGTFWGGREVTGRGDTYFSYFPMEDGKENRDRSFDVDKYGSHLELTPFFHGECDSKDLISEYRLLDLQWVWGTPDKVGIWAYGGNTKDKTPEALTVDLIENVKGACLHCWRCYLGPIPQISQPKRLVKQTLWMVKYHGGSWEQLWLPDEEVPKFESRHDVGHKTTTTREV